MKDEALTEKKVYPKLSMFCFNDASYLEVIVSNLSRFLLLYKYVVAIIKITSKNIYLLFGIKSLFHNIWSIFFILFL